MRDRLLHLTDFHFWEIIRNPLRMMNKRFIGNINVVLKRRREFLIDRADAYADYAGSLGIEQAVLTGDFASTSTPMEFELGRRFVERLEAHGIRPIVVPGNHDVYTFESVRKKRFEHYFGRWLPDSPLPCTVLLEGGTPLVLAPTVRPNFLSSQGFIHLDAVRAIETLLHGIDRPVLVAAHYPLLHTAGDYVAPRGRRLLNAGALREAIGRHPHRVLYLAGHNHRFDLTDDPDHANLTHLTTGSLFWHNERVSTEGECCELGIEDDRIEVIRHVNREGWTREPQREVRF